MATAIATDENVSEGPNVSDGEDGEDKKFKKKLDKKKARRRKRIDKEEEIQRKKLAKLEKKHWIEDFRDSIESVFRKTVGYLDIEFAFMDKFPREEAKELQQNVVGLVSGILMAYGFFFLLVFTFRRDIEIALYFCMVLLVLTVFGISFSTNMRCVFVLVGPCLASSRLRWILLMYASGLTAVGPGINILRNTLGFRSSVLCVYDQIQLNIEVLKLITKAPFKLVKNNLVNWGKAIRDVWRKLKNSVGILKFGLFNTGNTVNQQINYFQVLLNACNDKVALYNQCIIFFNNVYHNCRHKLRIGKEMCYMVRYIAKDACKVTEKIKAICDNTKMKLNKLNSTTAKKIGQRVEAAFEKLLMQVGRKETSIFTNENTSKEPKLKGVEVTNVSEKLKAKADKMMENIAFLKWMMEIVIIVWTILTISIVFFQASFFRSKWLKKDSFQNVYMTKAFAILEKEAINNRKLMALPLIGPEKRKYISLNSSRWTKAERNSATRGAGLIFLSSVSLICTMILDYFMYAVLLIMEPIFDTSYKADKTVQMRIIIGGVSTIGSFIKTMLSVLGPLRDIITDVDLPICKPTPRSPNYTIYVMVIGIVTLAVVSLAFQVRILRSRHRIMLAFYPERSVQRAIWLRNYIRNTRGSTKKFMLANVANKFKRKKNNQPQPQKMSVVAMLISRSKICAKILEKLGKKRVFCLSCNTEGDPKNKEKLSRDFTQCLHCHSMFCKSCYLYFKNLCLVCRVPLETAETEVDLQKLTSDEDYEDFKSKYVNIINKQIDVNDIPGNID